MREFSQHVLCRPHRWHCQRAGSGPSVLLIHGAGGATQSWRNLFPILAESFDVLAVDLPGQGFTKSGAQSRHGLNPTAKDLLSLLQALDVTPTALIGHSAGVPIAMRMVQLGCPADRVFGINAALSNFDGIAGWLFPFMAKALSLTPFAANVFAATTSRSSVHQLLKGTGSNIGQTGEDLYLRLAKDPDHVDGTLSMMAQWSLDELLGGIGSFATDVHLLTGKNDKAVPPRVSSEIQGVLPNGSLNELPGLGHLAHEEDADAIADWVLQNM